MDAETGELWRKFCEQAAVEEDAEKLLKLAQEINRLLDEKEVRLQKLRQAPDESTEPTPEDHADPNAPTGRE